MVNGSLSEGAGFPVHSGQRVPLRIVDLGKRGRGVVAGRRIEHIVELVISGLRP